MIDTVAGNGAASSILDGVLGTTLAVTVLSDMVVDRSGNVVYVDLIGNRVRRVDGDGLVEDVAGNGIGGVVTDGVPARKAPLNRPSRLAIDGEDRVLVLESGRVWRVEHDGTLRHLAGGSSDSSAIAVEARLSARSLAVGDDGAVFVNEVGRLRRFREGGTIETVAGMGVVAAGPDGDALTTTLAGTAMVVAQERGRQVVYLSEGSAHRVRKIDEGIITTVAGTGVAGFSGDGEAAVGAQLSSPSDLALDAEGRLLIADLGNRRVRRLELDGVLRTVAGDGLAAGGAVDDRPVLGSPLPGTVLACLPNGRLVVASTTAAFIDDEGRWRTLVGAVHPGGLGRADRSRLYPMTAIAVADGRVLSIGNFGRMPVVEKDIVTVGLGTGSPTLGSTLASTSPAITDASGVLVDTVQKRLVIASDKTIELVVGSNGPPRTWQRGASANTPVRVNALAADPTMEGSFFGVDTSNSCVRRLVDTRAAEELGVRLEVVEVLIGTCGTPGSLPGFLGAPTHVAVSARGAVYIADTGNHRVLRVDPKSGAGSVILGEGTASSAGEGAPARLFPISEPRQLALDEHGNLFVAAGSTVRMVRNVDGDDDADGDDEVVNIFGAGARLTYPESDARCVHALALTPDGVVMAADACQGFLVALEPTALGP